MKQTIGYVYAFPDQSILEVLNVYPNDIPQSLVEVKQDFAFAKKHGDVPKTAKPTYYKVEIVCTPIKTK